MRFKQTKEQTEWLEEQLRRQTPGYTWQQESETREVLEN